MTEYLLPTIMGTDPRQKMDRALKIGTEVDWVRMAEKAISGKLAGCEWHLEDPDGDTIDEEYGEQAAVAAYKLLLDPQGELPLSGPDGIGRRQTRRQLLSITSRHMGLAGNGCWMLDKLDDFGCPHAILYIRPGRLEPQKTGKGVLKGWLLDKKPGVDGIPIDVEELLLFQFAPPDVGIWGIGLIESCMAKAINNGLIDRHYSALLASGGRISGILSPQAGGAIHDDNVYEQLKRDWRNITEQPESARRLQIVRAPIEFTSTVQSVGEMQIIDLMYHNRDALLALWGVPLSQLGGTAATGMNSGEVRKYEEASLWQGAVHDRIEEVRETIQQGILDRWEEALGWSPKLIFDEPSFDDEEPSFNKLAKAAGTPLRNKERREIIGLDPFGDEALDNAIWMPVNVVAMAMAPDEDTGKIPPEMPGLKEVVSPTGVSVTPPTGTAVTTPAVAPPKGGAGAGAAASGSAATGPASAPRQIVAVKASAVAVPGYRAVPIGARRLRDNMEARLLPRMTDAVQAALDEQRTAIARAVERHWETIKRHAGRDDTLWWTPAVQAPIERALKPAQTGIAEAVEEHITDAFRG